jgi:hypothetical protein
MGDRDRIVCECNTQCSVPVLEMKDRVDISSYILVSPEDRAR